MCGYENTPSICRHICFDDASPNCQCQLGFVPCTIDSNSEATGNQSNCISTTKFCDDVEDCFNGIDEHNCYLSEDFANTSSKQIRCRNFQRGNRWAPEFAFPCDNSAECFNMEDECDSGCEPAPDFCQNRTFAGSFDCPQRNILPGKLVCNGLQDCELSRADEEDCPGRFYCRNSSKTISVSHDRVCDFVVDCDDESDEQNCFKTHFYCENNQLPPYFVSLRKKMDGNVDCKDGSDECPRQDFENSIFSSHQFLIKAPLLRFMIWIMGIIATLGNLYVFVHTIFVLRHPGLYKLSKVAVVNSLLVLNLCSADFLMGVYLLFLAGKNAQTSGAYCYNDRAWRSGAICGFLGTIATLSAEVSLITLAILASYRLYCVLRPIQSRGMTLSKAFFHVFWSWSLGFVLALLPFFKSYQDYFITEVWIQKNPYFSKDLVSPSELMQFCEIYIGYNSSKSLNLLSLGTDNVCSNLENSLDIARSSPLLGEIYGFMGYYSAHATCLPKLFLSNHDKSWEFSFGITLFNFFVCFYIVVLYVILWSTRNLKRSTVSKSTKSLQRRIAVLVCSDCACWLPICTIAFLHFGGVQMLPTTYAVTAVILLPINSALNPIFYSNALQNLYTKTLKFLRSFEAVSKLRQNMQNNFWGRCMKKHKPQLAEHETSLLQRSNGGPDASRIVTELTFDYSSLPESTV